MSKKLPPERFAWALEVLDVRSSDHLLEIGCGTGILATQIASSLETGKLIALDKSEVQIRKAIKQNAPLIAQNKLEFVAIDFSKSHLENGKYDIIFAFNVSVFWKNPVKELALIRTYLTTKGQFYLFHQPPLDITRHIAEQAAVQLRKNKFEVMETLFKEMAPVSASCIISRPLH